MGNYGLRVRRFYSIFLIMILLEIDFLGKQIVIYPTLGSFSLRVFPFLVLFSFFFTFPSTFGFVFTVDPTKCIMTLLTLKDFVTHKNHPGRCYEINFDQSDGVTHVLNVQI